MSVNESKLLSDIYDDVDDTDIFEFHQNNDEKDDAKSTESNKDDNSSEREELRLKNEQLLKNNQLLERRISEIYLTAKAEVERKNKRIEELNEEINKLVIKFNHGNINKFKKDYPKQQQHVKKEETVSVNAYVKNNNKSTKVFSTNLQKAKPPEIIVLEDEDDDSIQEIVEEKIVKNLPNNHPPVDNTVVEINPGKPVEDNKVPAKNEEKKNLINLVNNEIDDNKSTSMLINEIVDKEKCMLYSKKEKTRKLSTEYDENNKAEQNKNCINNSNPPENINITSNKPINLKENCSRNKKIEKPSVFNAAYKIPKKSTDYSTINDIKKNNNEKVSASFRKTDFAAHHRRRKTSPSASRRRRRSLHRFPRTPSKSPPRRRRNEDYPYKDTHKNVRSKIVSPRAKRPYYSPPKDRHGNVIPPYNQWKKLQIERNKLTKLKDYQYRKRSCKKNFEEFKEEINFDDFKDLRPEVMQMSVEDLQRELELKVKELNDFELLSDFSDLSEPECWLTEGEDDDVDNAKPETVKKINSYEEIIDKIKEIKNQYSMDVGELGEAPNKTLMVSEQCKENEFKTIEDTEKIKKKINLQDYKKRIEEANTENLQQQLKSEPELEILLDRLDVSRNPEICILSSKKLEEFNNLENIQIQNTNSFMHDLSVSDDEPDLRKNENIKILEVKVFSPKKALSSNNSISSTTKFEDVECIEDIQKAIKNSAFLLQPTNKSTSHIDSVELEKCLEGDSPQKPSQKKIQEEAGLKTPLRSQLIRLFGSDSPLTPEPNSTKKKVMKEIEGDSEKLPIFCNNPNYIPNPPDATDRLKLAEILDSPTNKLNNNNTEKIIKNVQKSRTAKCRIKVKMDFGNKTKNPTISNKKSEKKKRKKVMDSDSETESLNKKAKKLRKIEEETNKKIQLPVKKLPHSSPHKKKELKLFEDKVTNLLLHEQKTTNIGKSPRRITPIKIGEITRIKSNNLTQSTNVESSSPLPRMEKMLKHFEEKTEELKIIKSSTLEDFAEILKENASTPKKIIKPPPKEVNNSSTLSVELKPYMIVPLKRHPRRRVKVMVL